MVTNVLGRERGRWSGRIPPLGVALWGIALLFPISAGLAQTVAKPVLTPKTPASPSNPVVPGAVTVMDTDRYIIGPEDILLVTVWKEPDLSGTFPVRPDGMISIVGVGAIPAAGLTTTQLGANITLQLKKYVQDPIVTVGVQAVNSQRVFITGEVAHTGPIPLSPGMTPLQAIITAGGPTPYANAKHIYILRGPQGKQQKIAFNYKLALKGDNRQNIPLLSGDMIVVP
jgi:polysaccharide biosynthesis/export protein